MAAPKKHPQRKRRLLLAGLIVAALVIVLGVFVGLPLLQTLMNTYEPWLGAYPTTTPFTGAVSEAEITEIGDRLRAVGLAESDYLLSTGVVTHLQRLRDGEISPDALRSYADHLETLNEKTAAFGEAIPTAFWDVQTQDMHAIDMTEYDAVAAMTLPGSSPYRSLLARAYNRLAAFHEADGDDTALDAAFDIFQDVADYYEQINEPPTPDDPDAQVDYGTGIILIWQQVMFSTSRNNPLSHDRLISHSIYNHFNITDMWRYRTGDYATIGEIWGVSGFAPRFVGDPANDNQVEHTTISMTLQLVMDEPLTALNLIEDRDVIAGNVSAAYAAADKAINTAVGRDFAPRFHENYREGIEYLRCLLADRDTCSS